MAVIALDFDGVLCNSARETAISAWRAGAALWPEWRGEEPPESLIRRFVAVRPYLETGYQAVPMMRMVADGRPDSDFRERLLEICGRIMAQYSLAREELVNCFGEARDAWIARDENDWLSRHEFYPGVVERLSAAKRRHRIFILTTKQERFVKALLKAAGIDLPDERVHGLERGLSKEDALGELLAQAPSAGADVHFVEDRLDTLRRVQADPRLDRVRLYYAAWGYGTPADLTQARADDRIRVWTLEDFLEIRQAGTA